MEEEEEYIDTRVKPDKYNSKDSYELLPEKQNKNGDSKNLKTNTSMKNNENINIKDRTNEKQNEKQ